MSILSRMGKALSVARRIRDLKPGQFFLVYSTAEQQFASKQAAALRDAGVLTTQIVTRKVDGQDGVWKVACIG